MEMGKTLVENFNVQSDALEMFSALKDKHLTFWCAGYAYRGKVTAVNQFGILLTEAFMIEVAGPAKNQQPEREDENKVVFITFQSIENVMETMGNAIENQ